MRDRGRVAAVEEVDAGQSTSGRVERRAGAFAPPVRGRRRPWLMALGALLTSVATLVVVWMVGAAGQRQEVLVVRQPLAYGDEVTTAHLGIARVSVDPGVEVIPASDRAQVLGLVAATRLAPGTLLTTEALAAQSGPPSGQVLVPIALPVERMPAGGLSAGDRILAVTTGTESEAAGTSFAAVVARVGEMDVNGITVVDVTTAGADGPRLTVAAAEGQVAILVQPSGG